VVVVLLYGETSHRFEYSVLGDGDADSSGSRTGVRLVRVTQDLARRDPTLRALYDEETMKAEVDRLNRLYVALTRAKREMYVIGVKSQRDGFPFDLLPAESWRPSPEKGQAVGSGGSRETAAELSHRSNPVKLTFDGGPLGREERRRGELVHRILELTLYAGPDLEARLTAAAERAAREMRSDVQEARDMVPPLERLLLKPEMSDCFLPAAGRSILTEQEVCDSEGRLVRMDRVIVDAGRLTVVDYKTGLENPAAHESQVRDYMRILSEAFPGRGVSALLAYVDLGTVRTIS
jgi:ATP-dependent exoDNAse (exonuclease V) beta subunit